MLQKQADDEIENLMILMPPQHGKSELQIRYLIWRLMRDASKRVVHAAYNFDYAHSLATRTKIAAGELLDHSKLSNSLTSWRLASGGTYRAVGIGTGLTGHAVDLAIIDDPFKDREEANSEVRRETVWLWYTDVLRTRGNVRKCLIMCMVGDTPVLMEDGTERPLRDVRPGDRIATYDDGKVGVSTVRNWADQGPDAVYEIRMKSGVRVKANARHPFLVETSEGREWRRTGSLKPGDSILRATGESGAGASALKMGATSQQDAKASVCRTMASDGGRAVTGRLPATLLTAARCGYEAVTGLMARSIAAFLPSRAASALFAGGCRRIATQSIGETSSALTIVTKPALFEEFSAIRATSPSVMQKQNLYCSQPLSTYEITADEVLEVVPTGIENVFDLEVDRTANFIANGLVSHNTPWHEDDLRGRILASPEASSWTVCRLPAIAEEDDPLGREVGEALCPDRKTLDELLLQREMNPYSFQAMFQCHPTAREGSIFRVGELKIEETCPRMVRKVRHWDLAASEKKQSDYTAGVLLGADEDGKYWVLDVQRGQWLPEVVRERILTQARLDGRDTVIHLPQDPGQAGKAQARDFVSRLAGFSVSTDLESGDKVTRAMPIASQVNSGNVHLISAAWNRPFVEELRSFSQGVHDDQVDAISGAFNHITVGMGYLGTEELAW